MEKQFIKLSWLIPATLALLGLFIVNSCSKKQEFCSVIVDLRKIDAVKVVNTFDQSKVAYYVDLHNGYQILVAKSQVQEAYLVLASIGIEHQVESQTECRSVH